MSNPLQDLNSATLFEAAADAQLLSDDHGMVVAANPAAADLLGYPHDTLLGLPVERLMPERLRARHTLLQQEYLAQPRKRPMCIGKNLVALDCRGNELPVDISLSPLRIGERLLVLITLYNASRRRQTEEDLRTGEERLLLAKRAAGLGIFDGDLMHGLLHWDERSRELWGFAPDQEISVPALLQCVHPADRAQQHEAASLAMDPAGSGEYQSEFRILRHNDGAERWMAVTGRVLFEAGRAARLVGVVKDITEQKAMERKLQEQRAETEALFKQQVAMQTASAIAHELNQPLTAISAYGEVASHELDSGNMHLGNLRRALSGCATQAQHAGRILNELLAFLQEGDPATEPLDLGNLVREALGIMQNDGYGGFFPVLQLERGMPPVLGNRIQLQKVLVNLLRNGVEAMRTAQVPRAFITISAHALAEQNMAQITIQDNGPGLAEDTARRIFDPFFTTKDNGIGMGLAISRSLIESHGGQLWLDAQARPGATFHLTLPTAP